MDILQGFGPVPLPGPPLFFRVLLGATFWLHLVAVLLLVGVLIVSWARSFTNVETPEEGPEPGVRQLPVVMAVLINLGIPPFLFLQLLYGPVFYSSSILLGWVWMGVIPLLMLAYGGLYLARYSPRRSLVPVYLGASLAVVLGIAYIFSNNMVWMLDPERMPAAYALGAAGGHLYPDGGLVVCRWLWILAPSLALGAAWLGRGKGWIWASVALGLAGGIGLATMLPPVVQESAAGWLFWLDYGLLALLAGSCFTGDVQKRKKQVLALVLFRSGLVVLLRDQIRSVALSGQGFQLSILEENQLVATTTWPLALFVASLVVAGLILAWMWRRGREGVVL